MWFGDYILPEFCRLSHFFLQKNDVGYLSPTPNIIEPYYSNNRAWEIRKITRFMIKLSKRFLNWW